MDFYKPLVGHPRDIGILAGAFHPVTRAHMALARAALPYVDAVVFVVPRAFPHKDFEGASLDDRIAMLQRAASTEPRFGVAASDGGLFIEIARELRAACPGAAGLKFVCGRDAAERFLNWDYADPGAVAAMLLEFEILAAPRGGPCRPPADVKHRIHTLPVPPEFDGVSSSEVRRKIHEGEPWEHLVPAEIVETVRALYR